ncbi:MAG: beta-ketoacyl-[acyl-carrier-protein] synthase family protein [Succinivibrio sp.]|nr:beta-ketoacyl-[acyl-carrier-protein] synthase family protein [Succinivibrio sp.]
MIYIKAYSILNALGNNCSEVAENLRRLNAPGLSRQEGWLTHNRSTYLGRVTRDLSSSGELESPRFRRHNSRNNRMLVCALEQIAPQVKEILSRVGSDRLGIVMGTSTSGLDEAGQAVEAYAESEETGDFWNYSMQELGDPSRFLQKYLNLTGPAFTISTACSSSARAIISAVRLIESCLCDAALAGGADTLSRMPINGFDSMGVLSTERCLPFCRDRCGINIGEGAGLMLLVKEPCALAVLGYGESSDAYHVSAPSPDGSGAVSAMSEALKMAGLKPSEVGYISLHGTATPANDRIESLAVNSVFGEYTPCSSTKYLTGHTLGAAGITEAVMCALLLERDLPLPPQDFSLSPYDETLTPCGLLREQQALKKRCILSNSFAFGGNNAVIAIGESRD